MGHASGSQGRVVSEWRAEGFLPGMAVQRLTSTSSVLLPASGCGELHGFLGVFLSDITASARRSPSND